MSTHADQVRGGLDHRPIRVAQIVTKFLAGAGGITLRGALALDQDRFAVTIMSAGAGPLAGPLMEAAERAGLGVVRLEHMAPDLDPREDLKGIGELTAILRDGSFGLVHTHSAKAGGIGRLAARRAGVPAIVHSFHGFPFHEFQSAIRRRAYIAMERALGRFTDQFLTDGGQIAAEAVRLRIAPPERIRAIASPVDTDQISRLSPVTRAEARRRLGLSPKAQVVGSVGRLDYQKAPGDMVAALARMGRPDVRVVWIGDGPLRARVEAMTRRLGLADRFVLVGERADVPALLPAFDVFAMSSLYEGLPCAVVEAMTCGVPVVATAVNSVPEVVIPGKTGLLARPSDPGSLARAIGYLVDHPEEGTRMALAASAHLGDRFTGDALGRDLTEVYALALGRPAPAPAAPLSVGRPA